MNTHIFSAMQDVLYDSTHDKLDTLIIALGMNPEDEVHRNSVMNVMFNAIDNKRLNEEKTFDNLINISKNI